MKRNTTRTVKRTWTTKSGITKTKTFTYTGKGKSRRGLTLVGKNGRLNKKNVEKFKNEINADNSLTAAEKRGLIADLNIITKQRVKDKSKLTTTGFYGELASTKISTLLANAGYSIEEAAEELGITEADILESKNWRGDILTVGAASWAVKFTYTGSLFTAI
jgi:hypothetical protein